jgi:hypothetical protein
MTLTEFLLARIAEDEYARLDVRRWPYPWIDIQTRAARQRQLSDDRRVFLECDAKRRIVERALAPVAHAGQSLERDATLRDLAAAYADHPDYDEAWRP